MALITGSVARGIADDTSDLDIYLYCDLLDRSLPPTQQYRAVHARPAFQVPTSSGWFAKLEHDQRYIDVEAVDTSLLERTVDVLCGSGAPPGWVVKLAVGLRDATAIVGKDELDAWNRRLEYRDETAAAEVAFRSARLLSPVTLFELSHERGDVVSFSWRVSQLVLDTVALLGAVNRRFIPVDDPKWIPWHVAELSHRPADFMERAHLALSSPTRDTMTEFHAIIECALDLVDDHVPDVDTRSARFALRLHPRPL